MIAKRFFVNKIRELGYTHHEQKKRVDIWRKRGGDHYVSIPRCDNLEDAYVVSTLRQCGLKDPEIKRFVTESNS